MIVRRPSKDICDKCFIFFNQSKFDFIQTREISDVDEASVRASDPFQTDSTEGSAEAVVDFHAEADEDALVDEAAIAKATKHVKMAKDQRAAANAEMRQALNDSKKDAPWDERHDCLVANFCQNLGLPFLEKDQPGETYYFSPLTVNCFGVINTAVEKHELTAFLYHEGEGKKGGNVVASLLYKFLKEKGWLDQEKGARKQLTLVMDNCSGQNKNRMVLHFAVLLVELDFYIRVEVFFLVTGHTKNCNDRLFNLLKQVYRKQNMYTMDQLATALDTNRYVTPIHVKMDELFDFDSFEDTIY